MGTKIYHAIKPALQDQTGLQLCGRHQDGRYQYHSLSVFHDSNIVSLTHEQRVGLAVCCALAKEMRGFTTIIYPMSKAKRYEGFGTYGDARLWMSPVLLNGIGVAYLGKGKPAVANIREHYWDCGKSDEALGVLAHEMGHNTQRGGKPHGPEFKEAHIKMRLAMKKVLAKGWPKLDMRKLRDSVAPHLVKKANKQKRREVAASESRTSKWERKLIAADRNLHKWRKALIKAERMIAKWEKALHHASVFLGKARKDEGVEV